MENLNIFLGLLILFGLGMLVIVQIDDNREKAQEGYTRIGTSQSVADIQRASCKVRLARCRIQYL